MASQRYPAASSHAASRYQSNGLDSGAAPPSTARQTRNRVWATRPAAANAIIRAPRTPERKASRDASQASATV
ncbi:MAG: hypothetical protein FJ286_02410 [Planctomycetes bacterium]|nr:hypothetical protein [Planctomycetota bacterium]